MVIKKNICEIFTNINVEVDQLASVSKSFLPHKVIYVYISQPLAMSSRIQALAKGGVATRETMRPALQIDSVWKLNSTQ